MLNVLLPADFRDEHRQIVLQYLYRGHDFDSREWHLALTAFDLLRSAVVQNQGDLIPFPVIYLKQVEDLYADSFIEHLHKADDPKQATRLWAEVAGKIGPALAESHLYQAHIPATRLLLAYCLYWWRSFTLGYALEIEIQRDLASSGIKFQAHNLFKRQERLSPYDISVLGFKGDIKTSIYFLQTVRGRPLVHDFYITRIRSQDRTRILVVFVKGDMWQVIDGETLLVLLEELAETLPRAGRIRYRNVELVVVDYETWKDKVRTAQGEEEL